MLKAEKQFLNMCLKKHMKKQGYTHASFAEGICDKYMISRLIHGYICKDKTYHALLERLGFHYVFNNAIIQSECLSSSLLLAIETDDRRKITQIIQQLEELCKIHSNHIYFVEINEYVEYMKIHYINHQRICIDSLDFSPFYYFPISLRISITHILCENLLFHAQYNELKSIFSILKENLPKHILLDYYEMILLQANKKNVDAYKYYRDYKYHLIEQKDTFNSLRYYILYTQGEIRKHPDESLLSLQKAENLRNKKHLHYIYNAFIEYSYMIIYIRENEYEKAYKYAKKGYETYIDSRNLFLPYMILLSIYLKKPKYDIHDYDPTDFNLNCISLYDLYNNHKPLEEIKLIIKYFPKAACENPCFETCIHILSKIIYQLSKETRRYKSVVRFFNKYQKYNRNYYL